MKQSNKEDHAKRSKPKRTPIAKILNQKILDPLITQKQLAEANNVSPPAISRMFKRYGINDNYLESFKKNRADIFAGIQETVASTLTAKDIKEASVRDRTILLGTIYDKERLERGLSTTNSAVIIASAVLEADAQASKRELSTSCQHVDKSPQPQDVVVDRVDIEVEGVSG